jgi:hypothetical protein
MRRRKDFEYDEDYVKEGCLCVCSPLAAYMYPRERRFLERFVCVSTLVNS